MGHMCSVLKKTCWEHFIIMVVPPCDVLLSSSIVLINMMSVVSV